MSKGLSIALIVIFVLVLVGILVFVVMKSFGDKATTPNNDASTNNNNNGGMANGVTDDELKSLADSFRTAFQNQYYQDYQDANILNRCDAIKAVNNLQDADLQRFKNIYYQKFNTTPKQEMESANVWCGLMDYFGDGIADKLFNRL